MLLVHRSSDLLTRLGRFKSSVADFDQSQSLDKLARELEQKNQQIQILKKTAQVFRSSAVKTTDLKDKIPQLRKSLLNISQKFVANPVSNTLKTGRQWDNLMNRIDEFIKSAKKIQLDDWNIFHQTLYGGLPPEKILTQLAMTPSNMEAMNDYKTVYNNFSGLRNKIPIDREEVDYARELAYRLSKTNFDYSVPDEVKQFLTATTTSEGANLSLLTPVVLQWLKENDLSDTYFVRAKRN